LKSYIYFLKTTFLISESEYYSKSRAKRIRKEKRSILTILESGTSPLER